MLVKWQPLNSLLNSDSFFEDFFPVKTTGFEPRIDVRENEKSFVISAELPGLSKDDFNLTVQDKFLTIEGEKKIANEETDNGYRRSERTYGSFKRSFRLTDSVDSKKIKADYKNGILEIDIPKAEKVKPKTIEVKVN